MKAAACLSYAPLHRQRAHMHAKLMAPDYNSASVPHVPHAHVGQHAVAVLLPQSTLHEHHARNGAVQMHLLCASSTALS
jgi:hypothetical protein